MKRTTLALILLAILVASCLMLTACDIFGHSCNFGEWAVIEQPNCTEAGLKVQVCECGESRMEIIPATGHSYVTVVIDPTCTEQGFTTHTCGDCGDSYVDTYVNATGHNYLAVVTEPTCTRSGFTTHTCDDCGNSYFDTYVNATGVHIFQQSNVCEGCGEKINDIAIRISFDMSATEKDSVKAYGVPRQDGTYDVYIKGVGRMKSYDRNSAPFKNYGDKLANVYIVNSITTIGSFAFYGCTSLTNITIPDGVTSIGYYAFSDCSGLTSVTIPNSVTSIGYNAFGDCTSLTSIIIDEENTVFHIADNCLIETGTKTLILGRKNSVIPADGSVTSIGSYAFYGCSLTNITIPDGVTTIGNHAFDGCSSLTSMVIPNSVTSIGWSAFSGCTSLTSITIPDSVTSIGSYAFDECSSLTSIMVDEENTVYHSAGNCLIETATKTLILGCKNSVIPGDGSVTSIGSYAFYGCYGLTSITIPDSVINIGDYAFNGCSSLTSITIPEGVFSIGYYAFSDCTSLTTVIFEDPNGWCYTRKDGSWGKNFSLTNTSKNADYFTDTHCDCNWYKNN